MEKLKLPIIKGSLAKPKKLSMDDYLAFVVFNLKFTFNKKINRQWKKMSAVNIPFVLR